MGQPGRGEGQDGPAVAGDAGCAAGLPRRPAAGIIHRHLADADVYFVANGGREEIETVCRFRVTSKQPELWHPETGRITPLTEYDEKQGCTCVPLRLDPLEFGVYCFSSGSGRGPRRRRPAMSAQQRKVNLPAPLPVAGPWQVQFPAGWGAPSGSRFRG